MATAVHFWLDLKHSELGLAMKYRTQTILLLIVLIPAPLAACLWDSDTLEEERRQFPSVLELITGKFLRHSPAFYEWRIADRKKRLIEEPENVALYDDLAVAYEKTGQTDLAIETILKKEEISPGLYETYANLGTFYIHAGRLEEGLQEIEKAIEINPEAHFGREVYQKLLVEYVLLKKADGKLDLPMSTDLDPVDPEYKYHRRFRSFVMDSLYNEKGWSEDDFEVKATEGVLGMMRFGNFDSPVLLEALSDLIEMNGREEYAKQLAARALLQASYVSTDPEQKSAYRQLAKDALILQVRADNSTEEVTLAEVEKQFLDELAEADAWYNELASREESWIKDGLNPEVEFAKLYAEAPSQSVRPSLVTHTGRDRFENLGSLVFTLIAIVLGVVCFVVLFVYQFVQAIKAERGQTRSARSKSESTS